jgi:hypothetical protein
MCSAALEEPVLDFRYGDASSFAGGGRNDRAARSLKRGGNSARPRRVIRRLHESGPFCCGWVPARADRVNMELSAYLSGIKQLEVSNQISVAVARKSLDAQKQEGAAAIALLEGAAQTAPGASPDGVGTAIDVQG